MVLWSFCSNFHLKILPAAWTFFITTICLTILNSVVAFVLTADNNNFSKLLLSAWINGISNRCQQNLVCNYFKYYSLSRCSEHVWLHVMNDNNILREFEMASQMPNICKDQRSIGYGMSTWCHFTRSTLTKCKAYWEKEYVQIQTRERGKNLQRKQAIFHLVVECLQSLVMWLTADVSK